ncbi:hypothetical protein I316_03794 [Kwoniella heveanensis BCC8398]|uniref:Uncharacterized protein n=1 Tax=Kwoniella heveanensis BCC8398 TaxID=1296120 RepID=A0A1B9GTB1_9TREE|nr:hypothetical protein I316_03794 [Kwoniella heveanensis BCC8398]
MHNELHSGVGAKRPLDVYVGMGTQTDSPARSHLPPPSLTSTATLTGSTSSMYGTVRHETTETASTPTSTSLLGNLDPGTRPGLNDATLSLPPAPPVTGFTATLDSLAKLRQFKAEVEASRSAKASASNADPNTSTTAANGNTNNGLWETSGLASTSSPALSSAQGTGLGTAEFDTSQLAKMAQSFIEKQQRQSQPQPESQRQNQLGSGNDLAPADVGRSDTRAREYPSSALDREHELRGKLKSRHDKPPRSPQADLDRTPQDRDKRTDTAGPADPTRASLHVPPRISATGKYLPPLPSDPRFTRRDVTNSSQGERAVPPRDSARSHAGNAGDARSARSGGWASRRDESRPTLPRQGDERSSSWNERHEGHKPADRIAGVTRPPPATLLYEHNAPAHTRSRSRSRSPPRAREPYPRESINRAQKEDPYESYAASRGLPTMPKDGRALPSPYPTVDLRDRGVGYPDHARNANEYDARRDPRYSDPAERESIRDRYSRRSPPPAAAARRHPSPPREHSLCPDQRFDEHQRERDRDSSYKPSSSAYVQPASGATSHTLAPPQTPQLAAIGLDANNVVETLQALKAQISKLEKLVPASLVKAVSSPGNTSASASASTAGNGNGSGSEDPGPDRGPGPGHRSGPNPVMCSLLLLPFTITECRDQDLYRLRLLHLGGEVIIRGTAMDPRTASNLIRLTGIVLAMAAICMGHQDLIVIITTTMDTSMNEMESITLGMIEDEDKVEVELEADQEVEGVEGVEAEEGVIEAERFKPAKEITNLQIIPPHQITPQLEQKISGQSQSISNCYSVIPLLASD